MYFGEVCQYSNEIDCESDVRGVRLGGKGLQCVHNGMDDTGRKEIRVVVRIVDENGKRLDGLRMCMSDGAE